ncbi:hypothetical protein [Streptomyces anulatus]|uniref:hypothetical protein n=1 Tax=Streptomyces anulatus TaxID=1892 RepID=UPI001D191030|nr:hypothetical protein [Streptomyces anulatus]
MSRPRSISRSKLLQSVADDEYESVVVQDPGVVVPGAEAAAGFLVLDAVDVADGEFEDLAEERENYLAQMLTADLPETVKVCLYALSGRLGTATLTDTRGVKCSKVELAAETGLDVEATCLSLYLAEAHGWVTEFHDDEARLTVPGEDIAMYQGFLDRWKRIVAVPEVYGPLQEAVATQAAAELSAWGGSGSAGRRVVGGR